MTKKRKLSGATPETQHLTRNAPDPAAEAEARAFQQELDGLFDHWLEHGCACRFPRVRATAGLETAEVGAPHFTTSEQQWLVHAFDRRIELRDRENHAVGHRGRCSICGAGVERWAVEPFKSAWIDYLRITPAAGIEDIGAPVQTPVPHCSEFFSAAPRDRDLEHLVRLAYPKVPRAVWLAWMRELA